MKDDLETALIVYQKRFGIEAMFKDCKTGGYNLEGSKASPQRLVRESAVNCFGDDHRLVAG
jgi:hypothetical protein